MDEARSGWKRIARLAGGWALVVLGVAGLILPVAPGVPFLLAGLGLLAVDYPWARRWLDQVKGWVARVRGAAGGKKESAEPPRAV